MAGINEENPAKVLSKALDQRHAGNSVFSAAKDTASLSAGKQAWAQGDVTGAYSLY